MILPIEYSSVVDGEYSLSVDHHVTILGFNDHNSNMRLIREYSTNTIDCRVVAEERTFNYFNVIAAAGTTVVIAVTFQILAQVQDLSDHRVGQIGPSESKRETALWLWAGIIDDVNPAMMRPMAHFIN
jgi:hypothetical protein